MFSITMKGWWNWSTRLTPLQSDWVMAHCHNKLSFPQLKNGLVIQFPRNIHTSGGPGEILLPHSSWVKNDPLSWQPHLGGTKSWKCSFLMVFWGSPKASNPLMDSSSGRDKRWDWPPGPGKTAWGRKIGDSTDWFPIGGLPTQGKLSFCLVQGTWDLGF